MGVSGWVFLLVPAYPGSPGPRAIKWLCVCVSISHIAKMKDQLRRFLLIASIGLLAICANKHVLATCPHLPQLLLDKTELFALHVSDHIIMYIIRCGILFLLFVTWSVYVWVSVCLSVCLSQPWTLQKQQNWSRCHLMSGLRCTQETVYQVWVQIPSLEEALWGNT